jgi:hypothetical protein
MPNVWLGTSLESDQYCWRADELRRTPAAIRFLSLEPLLGPLPSLDLTGIDGVIVGGESGPNARRLSLDWVRDLRDRCTELRISLFFKQVGGLTPKAGGRLLDGRTWDEFPVVSRRSLAGEYDVGLPPRNAAEYAATVVPSVRIVPATAVARARVSGVRVVVSAVVRPQRTIEGREYLLLSTLNI